MTNKPAKKSDLGKSWMKERSNKPKKLAPEYHLIVSEGTDTERNLLSLLQGQKYMLSWKC